METEITDLRNKRIEQSIVSISVKIGHAMKKIQDVKEMASDSENMLIMALQELEELYVSLDNPGGNGE